MKYLISCLAIFLVVAVCCYFWYQWEIEPYREAAERTRQYAESMEHQGVEALGQRERDNPVEPTVAPEQVSKDQSTDTSVASTPIVASNVPARTDIESVPPETCASVFVSPFGFGPYPAIPSGFPEPDIFESLKSMGDSEMGKALELQKRLIVAFYKQGKSLEGIGVNGDAAGRVYLNYPDVVYVSWDYWTDESGITHKYAGTARGHPDAMHVSQPYLDKGEIPPGITVYELPDGYIDAYAFLGLDR